MAKPSAAQSVRNLKGMISLDEDILYWRRNGFLDRTVLIIFRSVVSGVEAHSRGELCTVV